ncbi:MAG: PEP-CTERM sorting domain-containing protein [Tepidisphaerales bacterium]
MKSRNLLFGAALTLFSFSPARAAPVIFGSLGNFDCINDTGSPAHGFEIELDGCDKTQVYSTFGAPYNRYGTPNIRTVNGNTYVDWQSIYNTATSTWAATTTYTGAPGAANMSAGTGGHSLYINSGYPGFTGPNNSVPGDHFGVALSTTPTNTIYHWMIEDPSKPGTLKLAGTNVMVPAPVFQPVPANPAQIQVVVPAPPAPPPEVIPQWSDAIWAKVYTTVTQNADPVDLSQLVLGNPAVPGETETEISWTLLQTPPIGVNGGNPEVIEPADPAGANESVTRRFEFYTYIGGYVTEDHQASFDTPTKPDGSTNVGDFLGNQNVAANFAAVPEPGTITLLSIGLAGIAWCRPRRRKAAAA